MPSSAPRSNVQPKISSIFTLRSRFRSNTTQNRRRLDSKYDFSMCNCRPWIVHQ